MEKIIETYVWTCPECNTTQTEAILEESGPFNSRTCEKCGNAFDDEAVIECFINGLFSENK